MSDKGLLITLEGIEGAGKSTLLNFAGDLLRRAGREVVLTREPGGTGTGERIRAILLDRANIDLSDDAELLLIFAARAQHIAEVIRPALSAGRIVLCDRFTDASYAYQGGGRGIAAQRIRQLEEWALGGLAPDLTLLFDLEVETGLARALGRRLFGNTEADRFERQGRGFFARIRHAYLRRAEQAPERFRRIDAARPLSQVKQQLAAILDAEGLCCQPDN